MSKAATTSGTKGLVPRLRFPEFRNEPEWVRVPVSAVLTVRDERRSPNSALPLFSLTIEDGVTAKSNRYNREFLVTNPGNKKYKLVKPNDIVYNPSNLRWGAINYSQLDHDVVVSPIYEVLYVTDADKTRFDFVASLLMRPKQIALFITKGQGTLVERIAVKIDYLLESPITVPQRRAEQQNIADCLSSLDDVIAAHADKLAALKQHKQGLLEQLFPRVGETVPWLRFPQFRSAPDWKPTTVGAVCDVLQGYGFPLTLQGKRSGRYPFCKVSDISHAVDDGGGLLCTAANYVDDAEVATLRATTLPVGSTVFAKIGEALRLNRRALTTVACLVDNNATGLKIKTGLGSDYFVFVLSQRIDMNQHCGGAVPSISKSTLENIPVTIPAPDEQQRIADAFASVDGLIAAESGKLAALKQHKQGLLQQLFPAIDDATP